MCYDIASGTKAALKYAKHRHDDPEIIRELERQLELWQEKAIGYYYASGFGHPSLLVFTDKEPLKPQFFTWGLIPSWVKLGAIAKSIMNQTLNARAETIFEKPSFKDSAEHKRCLVYVDAFYEHHHFNGKVYPFRIEMKDGSPMILAGLWSEWLDEESGELIPTVSIITTAANPTMARIHNHPKISESRMPAIIKREKQDEWLSTYESTDDQQRLLQLIQPFEETELRYFTVQKLKGKTALGNSAELEQAFVYPELTEWT